MTERWLTTSEAAAHARRCADTVRIAAARGELAGRQPVTPSGRRGHWRFRLEDVDRWVAGETAAVVIPLDRRRRRGA